MFEITFDLIKLICHQYVKDDFIKDLIKSLNRWLPSYDMDRKLRAIAFLAQCAHETGGFIYFKEIGGKDYCEKYEPHTNIGKMLGNTQIGDGYTYKGRGLLQITGRTNYKNYGKYIGVNLIAKPDLLLDLDIGVHVSCEFWKRNDLNHLADNCDTISITKKINGGLNGFKERQNYYSKLMKEWNNEE